MTDIYPKDPSIAEVLKSCKTCVYPGKVTVGSSAQQCSDCFQLSNWQPKENQREMVQMADDGQSTMPIVAEMKKPEGIDLSDSQDHRLNEGTFVKSPKPYFSPDQKETGCKYLRQDGACGANHVCNDFLEAVEENWTSEEMISWCRTHKQGGESTLNSINKKEDGSSNIVEVVKSNEGACPAPSVSPDDEIIIRQHEEIVRINKSLFDLASKYMALAKQYEELLKRFVEETRCE